MIKISVIVPIYKVEKYLHQCVDSILSQTYRNIEVILVDDGSPDACPQICDEYANKDRRIVVIHKKNEGLSEARNAGIEYATGELGLFVDGDDFWEDKDGLQELVDRHEEFPTEVLCFGYYKEEEENKKRTQKATFTESMPKRITSPEAQIEYLMNRGLYVASACNKLIDMELLKKLPFEKGKIAEDVKWCALLLKEAKSLDYINLLFYCYRQRTGSISQTISAKSCIDLKDAIIACCNITEKSELKRKQFIGQYTAYQFSTFIAVQALSTKFPENCIIDLDAYKGILQYDQVSRKVKIMHYGTKTVGLKKWCKFIRATRFIWNSRRDII